MRVTTKKRVGPPTGAPTFITTAAPAPLMVGTILPGAPAMAVPTPGGITLSSMGSFYTVIIVFDRAVKGSGLRSCSMFGYLVVGSLLCVFFVKAVIVFQAMAVIVAVPVTVAMSMTAATSLNSVRSRKRILMFFLPMSFLRFDGRARFGRSYAGRRGDAIDRLLSCLHINRRFSKQAIGRRVFMLFPCNVCCLFRPIIRRRFNKIKECNTSEGSIRVFLFQVNSGCFVRVIGPTTGVITRPLNEEISVK